ncbi:MAG: NVEALA domain-containing protein [Paraprevotella clara]|nr:NVEALA domain-containing protein [Paraprevotella clara]
MKKKLLLIAVCVASVVTGYISYEHQQKQKEKLSGLTLANIEALGSIEDYWNRPDYDCVDVTCNCVVYKYDSDAAQYMGKGKGTVARTWNCTGCGSCGWTEK